jgi:hypothetical protein
MADVAFLPNDATMRVVTLTGWTAPISRIQLQGGGNEGVLNSLCTRP